MHRHALEELHAEGELVGWCRRLGEAEEGFQGSDGDVLAANGRGSDDVAVVVAVVGVVIVIVIVGSGLIEGPVTLVPGVARGNSGGIVGGAVPPPSIRLPLCLGLERSDLLEELFVRIAALLGNFPEHIFVDLPEHQRLHGRGGPLREAGGRRESRPDLEKGGRHVLDDSVGVAPSRAGGTIFAPRTIGSVSAVSREGQQGLPDPVALIRRVFGNLVPPALRS
mmetsp:Transcript_39286/g.118167  ORF Transcript_39286/g.118167 Transcript_39286/m.118167 type:complete len:223 (-) Transcript_39286:520-1188(-)